MNMDQDEPQLLPYGTPQLNQNFKRPRRSVGSTPLSSVSESASPSPRTSQQASLTPDVIEHINGLKHLDDKQIFLLLEAARNGDRMRLAADRSSMSTLGSRSSYLSVPSSRVTSMLSDPRSSIASTDTSYSNFSAPSSRLSTASSRLSTISNTSAKNFACTFCDKALKSKPYWKSHEEEFHEQRLTWRCPDCEQIFHAGKRFREHHTKLHGCENCKQPRESGQPTSRKASPCVKKYEIVMHNKDAWGCGFCACLLTSWEERCEHIALHFEEKRSKWNFTNVILGLLKQADVSQAWNTLLVNRHGEQPNWPQFTWESKKCNRLRYKLETKWDTRMFDVEKLVQETYELAEIESTESGESSDAVECKTETFDFTPESSTTLPSDNTSLPITMDIDPEPPQMIPQQHTIPQQQSMPPNEWPVSTDMSQNTMSTDEAMTTFSFPPTLSSMSNDFSHPAHPAHPQSYHQSNWSHAGFVSTPDLVNFQQPNPSAYMAFTSKDLVQTPQQYESYPQFPRASAPPNMFHHGASASTSSAGPRRFVPKLVNIASPRHSTQVAQTQQPQDQPPPPPPKDENSNRFSRMMMRRRPSNISQHTVVSHWNDEINWG